MSVALALILCPFAILTFCFGIELFAGLWALKGGELGAKSVAPTVIIVPAHNEELNLRSTLGALKEAASKWAEILVVADNCTDATAAIARKLRVEVVTRFDADRRGKGFALDFARRQLREAPPEVVVIVDADCIVDAGSIERLVRRCLASGRPCQASYVQNPALGAPAAVQLSTFAFFIKNVVRQRAMQRLAGRVHLLGTGMAFPWRLFEGLALATSNIVEDLEIGLELADAGYAPIAVEEAQVFSDAATKEATLEQRRRWEGGYLATATRWVPRILVRSVATGDLGGIWAALDLLIPPLALLIILDGAVLVLAGLATWLTGAAAWPALTLAATLCFAGLALVLAWIAGGSRYVTLGALVRIPAYLLWKLPLYLGLARHGAPKQWVRTTREHSADSKAN